MQSVFETWVVVFYAIDYYRNLKVLNELVWVYFRNEVVQRSHSEAII